MTAKLWFLRRLDLFEGLSEAEMERLGALLHERRIRAGEDVVARPSGDRLYLLKEGRVRVLRGDAVVAVLAPGQMFGTSSLFGAAVSDQRAVALDEVVVCESGAAQFLAAAASHPRLATKLVTLLARQLFELEDSLARAASEPVERRLAELVLRLSRELPRSDGSAPRLEVRDVSQADLAKMVGASRETVSRLLSRWERDGIVRGRKRLVEIVDEAGLRTLMAGGG